MVFRKNQLRVVNLVKPLALLILSCSITIAQSHVTHIPINGKIESITNWLVSKPLPSTFYLDGKESGQIHRQNPNANIHDRRPSKMQTPKDHLQIQKMTLKAGFIAF